MTPLVPLGAGVALLLFLFKGKKGGGGSTDPTDPTFDPTKPVDPKKPVKPKKKGGADVFGDIKNFPADFDPKGNQVRISTDCSVVLVGAGFWPDTKSISAVERETLAETLAVPGNSVVGFVDYLMNEEGLDQPEDIAARIMVELSSFCWDVPVSQWPPAYAGFFNWLMEERLVNYVETGTIGDFDPNED